MILRTIRDVEIELKKLLAQIEELKAKKVIAAGVSTEQVLALINSRIREVKVDAPQSVKFQPEDIDSANHSGTIIHNLVHKFLEDVTFDDVTFTGTVTGLPATGGGNPFQFIQIKQPSPITTFWKIGNEAVQNTLVTSFVDVDVFTMEYVAKPSLVDSQIFFDGHLGEPGRRLKQVSTADLSVFPSVGPTPVQGSILTAVDNTGAAQWSANPASQLVRATSSPTLTNGTYTDVPGLVMSLPANVPFLLQVNLTLQFHLNDTDAGAGVFHNQAGPFIQMNGGVDFGKTAAAPTFISHGVQQWLFNATNPCLVKVQAFKLGSGASNFFAGQSTFTAIKVG